MKKNDLLAQMPNSDCNGLCAFTILSGVKLFVTISGDLTPVYDRSCYHDSYDLAIRIVNYLIKNGVKSSFFIEPYEK